MSTVKSDFLHELEARGYVHQATDEAGLNKLARSELLTGYIGFDCTAPSLHVGNLLSIMMLRKLQQTGHRPIVLIGGGTTKVGDPSGKDEARKLLSDAEIAANVAGIEQVFTKFLSFGQGESDALMVNNADWLDTLNYIDFLRDYGRHFSVNRMLTYELVKLRLEREQPLSFIEFNYMVLQAYDFVELYRRYGCRLQMGGSDQWGNIVSGIELGRRTDGVELFGVTSPLLTTSSGAKMGKTAARAPCGSTPTCSPHTTIGNIGGTARTATSSASSSCSPSSRSRRSASSPSSRARSSTRRRRSSPPRRRRSSMAAMPPIARRETARATFEQGRIDASLPTVEVSRAELEKGLGILNASLLAGFVQSTGEARRQIKGGGLKVNDKAVSDERRLLTPADLTEDGVIKLSLGKKRHALIRPV